MLPSGIPVTIPVLQILNVERREVCLDSHHISDGHGHNVVVSSVLELDDIFFGECLFQQM